MSNTGGTKSFCMEDGWKDTGEENDADGGKSSGNIQDCGLDLECDN